MKTDNINRFEIIDHTDCYYCRGLGRLTTGDGCKECGGIGSPGRSVVIWDDSKKIDISLQDDGRTLKVFVSDR